MLDHSQRAAILELYRQGRGKRAIARAMGVSRRTVARLRGYPSNLIRIMPAKGG